LSDKQIEPIKDADKKALSAFVKRITEPLSKHGWPAWLVYLFAAIGFIYILNPTAGFIEFIPDNIPVIGNLDEGVAFMLVLAGFVEFFEGWKYRKPSENKDDTDKEE